MPKYKKGQSGNPAGRPKGSKNRVTQDLVGKIFEILAELEKDNKGLSACAKQDPKWFLEKFIVPLLPKNIDITPESFSDIIIKFVKANAN